MELIVRGYGREDLPAMTELWNKVVEDGNAFPQENPLTLEDAAAFFREQSYTAVAELDNTVAGLYILHPNNVGRCGHLGNASYVVDSLRQGRGIGKKLVLHSLYKAKELGFGILQFNAVVASNAGAIHLYEKLGFQRLGMIPKGFKMKDGSYEDIVLFYYDLNGLA